MCVNELMNKMGQFDHVEYEVSSNSLFCYEQHVKHPRASFFYQGRLLKCRSNCEDQINSVFVTSSAYPNKRVFVRRPEFCYTLSRLADKCDSFKRRPLERAFPGICQALDEGGLGDRVRAQGCHEEVQHRRDCVLVVAIVL